VHDARTVLGGHVVGQQHLVGVRLLAREEVEHRDVAGAGQLAAGERRQHLRVLAQLTGVGGHPRLGQQVPLPVLAAHHHVAHVRVHRGGQVRRQGPRGGRPDQRPHPVQPLVVRGHGQAHGDGRVLPVQIDVVHLGLGVRQRRLAPPAVPEHPEALVDQALVPQGLERPHDALHVVQVERLVVVGEIDPAGLPGDVVLPFPGVAQHAAAAGIVERGDAHPLDLVLVLDAELLLRLDLGGQAVAVPAEAALHPAAAHGLVARHHVLDVAGQQVAVVRQAVGERRAVVEDVLVAALLPRFACLHAGLERAVLGPVVEDLPLQLGKRRLHRNACGLGARGGLASVCVLRVRHGCSSRFAATQCGGERR